MHSWGFHPPRVWARLKAWGRRWQGRAWSDAWLRQGAPGLPGGTRSQERGTGQVRLKDPATPWFQTCGPQTCERTQGHFVSGAPGSECRGAPRVSGGRSCVRRGCRIPSGWAAVACTLGTEPMWPWGILPAQLEFTSARACRP